MGAAVGGRLWSGSSRYWFFSFHPPCAAGCCPVVVAIFLIKIIYDGGAVQGWAGECLGLRGEWGEMESNCRNNVEMP